MNTTSTLTTFEQRGTLVYMKPDYTYKTVDGWFYLNGNTVVRRKAGGRNHSACCSAASVYEFALQNKINN